MLITLVILFILTLTIYLFIQQPMFGRKPATDQAAADTTGR